MSGHTSMLALAGGLPILFGWLAVAYRRYARSAFSTDRRRRLSRASFRCGVVLVVAAYGWLVASMLVDVPDVAGLEPLTVVVVGVLVAVVPVLVSVVPAMPDTTWV